MTAAADRHRRAVVPETLSAQGGRLGRHIHFDEQSRNFRVQLPKSSRIVTRTWERRVQAFYQGTLGSCTGIGAVGLLCTEPFRQKGGRYTLALARKIYSRASGMDTITGIWPPADEGSTVLGAMKALRALGLAKGYQWCFGLDDVLKTLANVGPVEVGLHWYKGFDKPNANGIVRLKGAFRGGHAFQLLGVDAERKLVWAVNSWGPAWGQQGRFAITWDDLDHLLHEDGEASTLIL